LSAKGSALDKRIVNVRSLFAAALVAAAAIAAGFSARGNDGPPSTQPDQTRPASQTNLLLISLDTTRADHVGCYGYAEETTPSIDALAAEGHRFTQAYALMPTTLPEHTVMLTGLYPSQLGVLMNGHTVPPQVTTLAERLKTHGFATAAFVGAYVLHPRFGLNQGFEVYQNPTRTESTSPEVVNRAMSWLKTVGQRPFFCFVHLYDPHAPYRPPKKYMEKWKVVTHRLPPAMEFFEPEQELTDFDRAQCVRGYDGEINTADDRIGELLDGLRQSGAYDNTIVVFTSDHGETMDELFERYRYAYDHGEFLYRRELHVPLIVRLPPSLANRGPAVHDELVTHLDLMPTMLELLGLPCDAPCEGRSLVPLLAGRSIEPRPVIAERHAMKRLKTHEHLRGGECAVIDGTWHLIASPARGDELLRMDADETTAENMAAQKPQVVRRLKGVLRRWAETKRPLWGVSTVTKNEEARARLKELGYIAEDDNLDPPPATRRTRSRRGPSTRSSSGG